MLTKLKMEIEKQGLKQSHIAAMIGIDYTLLSHYVTGSRIPPEDTVKKIAKLLKVSMESIKGTVR